ncbi:MAG: DUF2242 domain-containing protein [Burkholderiaceae bacterium]|nr:DUF2242 domain-containing protein [Pseudomonadota bacterium]MBS0596833.1 DUF2242 domain-containing protein [Pseudomonadota bacterium]MCO5115842.1 DUF2242 domain-containing protein [Burkholderiaceae bacterium]MCP5219131.1 DUF2242 domain-containing protein [Burkholderiaceae bacterium]
MVLLQTIRRLALVGAVLALGACSTLNTPPAPLIGYQPEAFNSTTHSRHFAAPAERTCEAARRALLSQGYVVTAASGQEVTARKYFQPDVEHHVQLEFRVVCAPEGLGQLASVAFASALKDQYVVRKVKESASLGVGGIGSLSLPLEGSMDSMVKIASETVSTAEVYERLFNLMGEYLGGMSLAAPPRAVRPS